MQSGGLGKIGNLRRKGNPRSAGFDDVHDAQQEILLDCQKRYIIRCGDIGKDFDIERRTAEPDKPDAGGLRLDLGVLVQQASYLRHHKAELVCRCFITQANDMVAEKHVTNAVILQVHGGELAIRNSDYTPAGSSKAGRTEADSLHRTHLAVDLTEVTDAYGLVGDNGDGSEKILDGLLRGKGDSNAADPKTGDDGSSIDTFNGEYYQQA